MPLQSDHQKEFLAPDFMNDRYSISDRGLKLSLQVLPGASKSAWAGVVENAFKLKLKAKPIEGQANEALSQFLSDYFQVSKSSITILHGKAARKKLVLIAGDPERLTSAIEKLIPN